MDKNLFCEIMPIIEKASPFIASLINDNRLAIVIGILGAVVNCDPHNDKELIQKLKEDQDLYAKLKNLDATHKDWLNYTENGKI